MTWNEIKLEVQKRAGLSGSGKYGDRVNVAMTAAGDLLHSVRWDCTASVADAIVITALTTLSSGLPTDVGIIDEKSVTILPNYQVLPGDVKNIIISPPADYGIPLKYIMYGGDLHFGCPTAGSDYSAKFLYWQKFATPTDGSETPLIVSTIGDGVFISAALWIFAKYLEMEEDQPVISTAAFQDLLVQARSAQGRNTFQGPSLEEIIRQRG